MKRMALFLFVFGMTLIFFAVRAKSFQAPDTQMMELGGSG